MSCQVIVRRARPSDAAVRADLVRQGFASHIWDAFLLFFFQELTLQAVVVSGAAAFILSSWGARALLAPAPAAAAALAAAVTLAHQHLAHKHVQKIHKEMIGLVAEVRGGLVSEPGAALVISECLDQDPPPGQYGQVVGTVSVSEFWGPGDRGWMHALAVHPRWRGRGVGGALVAGAGGGGRRRGLSALACLTSELQPAARHLAHKHGWQVVAWYHRQLCGPALTLALAHLALELNPDKP